MPDDKHLDLRVDKLPLDLTVPDQLPKLEMGGRLDVRIAEEVLSQQDSTLSRARARHSFGGLEVGLIQERSDAGEVANTVELSWRLPFGGETGRQIDLGERRAEQLGLQIRAVRQTAEREQAEALRAKVLAGQRMQQAAEALDDAELWMEEQVYRYSGMLIGPHDLLRAVARLRGVRSRHIAAQQGVFAATVDAHFVRAIPIQISISTSSAPAAFVEDAAH